MLELGEGLALHEPHSVPELLAIRRDQPRAIILAGGTDVIHNAKYGLYGEKPVLVSTRRLIGFHGVTDDPRRNFITVGSRTTLAEMASWLRSRLPILSESASRVGSPQIRAMGTLGGNIALDTRCFWYNKDRAWRETLGGCLKVDGKVCHVTGSTSKCVAARAGDTVGPLLLYGAVLEVHTTDGHIIEVPIGEAFTSSGLFPEHLNLPCGSFIRNVRIPRAPANLRTHFCKIAPRLAIDFATIALTIGATIEREVCETIRIVITSVRPDPRVLTITIGKPITEDIADEIAMRVERAVKPLTNVWGDPSFQSWRATRAGIETKRALMAFA